MSDNGNAPDCETCGLLEVSRGPVPDDGGDYTVLVVGEAPGADEDAQRRPFVGRSGQLLRSALRQVGFPDNRLTFTNIVRCRPPDNKTSPKHVRCCYRALPIKDNTRLVLLMGNTPLRAVLGESGIMAWNGVRVERDGIVYAPLLHPAYLLRNRDTALLDEWVGAMDDALNAYDSGLAAPADAHYRYVYPELLTEIRDMLDTLEDAPVIAFDTEFSYLDPYREDNKILAMSFATEDTAWAIPIDHPGLTLQNREVIKRYVVPWVRDLLTTHPYVVGHNIKMDQMQIDVVLGIQFEASGDTMLASYLADTTVGIHSLKRLAGYHLGMFEYDSELQAYVQEHAAECDPKRTRSGSYANIPLEILLPYAARDAAATYLLEGTLLQKLTPEQTELYYELMVPASNALYRMQRSGLAVDRKEAKRLRRVYTTVRHRLLDEILEDLMVQRYVRARKAELTGVRKERFQFNPRSFQQRSAVLYDSRYYGLEPLGTTDTGAPSTKRDYLEPYRASNTLVDLLVRYNIIGTILSTFIKPLASGTRLSADGRVRSSFNLHITETGRLSSSSFAKHLGINQQNLPDPDSEPGTVLEYQPIRNMFTHTWKGGAYLSIDYSGMELRVFASLAQCQDMIDILSSDRDFHTMIASMITGTPYDQITRAVRRIYKSVNFAILYGGSAYTLHRQTGLPRVECEDVIRHYFELFPSVPAYVDRCVRFAQTHGYIETPFGLRRALPDIKSPEFGRRGHAEREAVNTPVQGGAGMLTVLALHIIDQQMQDDRYRSMLVNTVHDSIGTDVYPGELERVVALQVDVMENIHYHAATYAPGIDLGWLICPLKVDVEVGTHYGSMQHYDWRTR